MVIYITFFSAALVFKVLAAGVSGSNETESLGLIIKSIEMVEEKPLLAAIFNIKTGRTIEYTVGDYIEGRLIRDILEDRIVIYDEITRHQYVLIYNDIVSAAESEDADVSVIKIKEKKRDIEDMNITNIFNVELNKIQGNEVPAYGTPDAASEDEKKREIHNFTRDFKESPDGFEQNSDSGNEPASSPGERSDMPSNDVPASGVSPDKSNIIETAATLPVELKKPVKSISPDTSENNLKGALKNFKPGTAAPVSGTTGAVEIKKTPEGTPVKIRDRAKAAPVENDILSDE